MSDRLTELQRQRALAQEQVAWFDREIARETGQPGLAAIPLPAATPSAAISPSPTSLSPSAARTADEILAQYQRPTANTVKDVKKGCYLYFVFLMGCLVIFAAGAYYLYINWNR